MSKIPLDAQIGELEYACEDCGANQDEMVSLSRLRAPAVLASLRELAALKEGDVVVFPAQFVAKFEGEMTALRDALRAANAKVAGFYWQDTAPPHAAGMLRAAEIPALLKYMADWERTNGCLAGILEDEYPDFMRELKRIAVVQSPRQAEDSLRADAANLGERDE